MTTYFLCNNIYIIRYKKKLNLALHPQFELLCRNYLSATLKLDIQISYIIFSQKIIFSIDFLSDNQGIVMLEIMFRVIEVTMIALITSSTILTESFGDEQKIKM